MQFKTKNSDGELRNEEKQSKVNWENVKKSLNVITYI